MRAFIFLLYFQYTSIFQNTNVLPQNTPELQHLTRCIINDQESELWFILVCHPQFLNSILLPVAATKEPATSCCALSKINFPRKGVNILREICLYLPLFPNSP